MKPGQIIPVLALALALSACGGATATSVAPPAQPAPAAEAPASVPRALDSSTSNGAPAGGAAAQQQIDRLVIKTADLSLQVENVREAEAAVRAKVQALGGYVVKAQNNGSDEDMTAQIT